MPSKHATLQELFRKMLDMIQERGLHSDLFNKLGKSAAEVNAAKDQIAEELAQKNDGLEPNQIVHDKRLLNKLFYDLTLQLAMTTAMNTLKLDPSNKLQFTQDLKEVKKIVKDTLRREIPQPEDKENAEYEKELEELTQLILKRFVSPLLKPKTDAKPTPAPTGPTGFVFDESGSIIGVDKYSPSIKLSEMARNEYDTRLEDTLQDEGILPPHHHYENLAIVAAHSLMNEIAELSYSSPRPSFGG